MFSVVIPLYNKAHIIEHTILSVLSQTFHEFEIIVIDDGSTDNGVEVIKKFTNDFRIRFFNQQNQGVSVARNRGIKESKFQYIAFLDADDEWLPNFLFKINEAIEKFSNFNLFGTSSFHKNLITGEATDSTVENYWNKIEIVDCFINPNLLPHTSAIVAKKSALHFLDNEYDVFPIGMKVCEDWACFHRLAISKSLVYIGIPLGIRNNNITGQITGQKNVSNTVLYQRWLDGVRYYNLVYDYWILNSMSNEYFLSYTRYNLRHNFKFFLINNNWDIIDLITLNLKKGIFNPIELQLYRNRKLKILSLVYINLNKGYIKLLKIIKWKI